MRANHHSPLVRRNYVLGVVNGALWQLANAFMNPSTVVPAFILALGKGDKIWVGVITACMNSGWSWPQAFLSKYLGAKRRLLPYYWFSAIGRSVAILALTGVVAFLHDASASVILWLIAILFMVYGSCGAVGIIPFMTIVSDSMPAALRGRFFGLRWLFGGLMGMGAGVVVKQILSGEAGLGYPRNYIALFAIASVIYVASFLCFGFVREPTHIAPGRELPMRLELARGPRLLRKDADFRRLILSRIFDAIAGGLTVPFMAPFALQYWRAPEEVIGVFLSLQAGAGAVSNLLWSRISDRQGNRKLLIVSSAASIMTSALVLTSLALPPLRLGAWSGVTFTLPLAVFSLAFIPQGFAMSGLAMGQTNYLLDIAPNRRRATYVAFSSLVMFPLAWWPVAGALIIGESRFVLAFAVALTAAIASFTNAWRLREPRAADLARAADDDRSARPEDHASAAGG
jgi:MFS family permease